jgi:glycosyltransferase involved in cell wall biosynthesis
LILCDQPRIVGAVVRPSPPGASIEAPIGAQLRVLVDARWISGAPASSHARYLRALASEWAKIPESPFFTLVGAGARPNDLVTSARVKWQAAPDLPLPRGRPGGRLWLNTVFTAVSLIHRPQVLFFPWSVVPRLLTAPAVVTVHDVCFRSQPDAFGDRGRKGDEQIRAAIRSASAVLTPSAESKRGIVAAYRVASEQVIVVRHGIEPRFHPRHSVDDDVARRSLGVASPYFLCVSTHEERKNLATLASAYVDLVQKWREPSDPPGLVLVGRSSAYTDLLRRRLARSVTATRCTHFIEEVSDRALAALYRGATAVLLPSLCEGFGFPLVEGVACGAPALVSDLPVFHELVGDAATYVPAQDVVGWTAAMSRAAADPDIRRRSEQSATGVTSAMSWRISARQTIDVLRQVAQLPSRRGWTG